MPINVRTLLFKKILHNSRFQMKTDPVWQADEIIEANISKATIKGGIVPKGKRRSEKLTRRNVMIGLIGTPRNFCSLTNTNSNKCLVSPVHYRKMVIHFRSYGPTISKTMVVRKPVVYVMVHHPKVLSLLDRRMQEALTKQAHAYFGPQQQ